MRRVRIYLVASPIGDYMSDFSVSALKALARVGHVFVEEDGALIRELRRTGVLTSQEILFLGDPSSCDRASALVQKGRSFAVLASTGIPGFVDPGHEIVGHCLARHSGSIELVPLGMSSALDAALAMAGFYVERFEFIGHFPEFWSVSRACAESGPPIVAFVRGEAVRAFVERMRDLVPNLGSMALFKDIRKKSRSKTFRFDARQGSPAELRDDPEADFVAVIGPRPPPPGGGGAG